MSEIRTDTINNASGDNDSGIDLSTNDQVGIKTADTTRVTVDSSGKVGIGTSSPENNLHVFTDAHTEGITIKSTGNTANAIIFDANRSGSGNTINQLLGKWNGTSVAEINFQTGSDTTNKDDGIIAFRTSSANNITERMRISSGGNIGMGDQTTPFSTSATLNIDQIGGGFPILCHRDGTGDGVQISFRNDNGQVGRINTSGSSTSYVTSSDHRLKENVTADWDATTRLKQLNPVRFNFIADADTTVDGFLAHEVQSVVPEAITGTHNEVDDDGNPVYQGIDQSKLVPLLVKTIQELEARITALENAE